MFILSSCCCLTVLTTLGQRAIDSFPICGLPVRSGIVYTSNPHTEYRIRGQGNGHEDGVSIITVCDSVFHFETGRVLAIFNYGNGSDSTFMVVIMDGNQEFYAYSNLRSVSIKKDETIKKGNWIGMAGLADYGTGRQVDFLYLKKGKIMSLQRTRQLLLCKPECSESTNLLL